MDLSERENKLITIAGRAIEILSTHNITDWAKRLQFQLDHAISEPCSRPDKAKVNQYEAILGKFLAHAESLEW